MNKSNDIKVRDLIESVNKRLEEAFNKPVIQDKSYRGYKYDEENGRKLININEARKIINEYTKECFSDEKIDIYLYNTPLRFKTKRKKSDMKNNYNYKIQMTVVEIYIENETLLDKTINEIIKEAKEQEVKNQQLKEDNSNDRVNNFFDKLKEIGIDFEQFKEVYNQYHYADYEIQQKMDSYGHRQQVLKKEKELGKSVKQRLLELGVKEDEMTNRDGDLLVIVNDASDMFYEEYEFKLSTWRTRDDNDRLCYCIRSAWAL